MIRPVVAWLAILVLAFANGTFREFALVPALGQRAAYIASGILLSALIVLVAAALSRWMPVGGAARAMRVGLLWLGLTLVFEFGLGIVQGRSGPELLAPYTFRDGNVWPLVLVVTLFAPYVGWRAIIRSKMKVQRAKPRAD
jgi:hypothetical protein